MHLSLRQFKDFLIQNRYQSYQDSLAQSLYNPYEQLYDRLKNNWGQEACNELHRTFPYNHKYTTCPHHHCHNTAYQYYKLSNTNNRSGKEHKIIILKYDHFKNRILTKKSVIKEYIWYNIKNEESIAISGNYLVEGILYKPLKPGSLLLNNIPVSYIELSEKNQNNGRQKCKLLYFCFDISSYCDFIDCVLKQLSFLPLEIVKYILLFTY